MEFTYENQGTSTYLVYKIAESDNLDTLSLGMLTNNTITGLIPAIFTQMDGERFIKYNVTAKVSVKQFFSGIVNKKRLTGVFSGIVNAMISAEEYMINPTNILLNLDYIYTDVSTCETNLVCLPIMKEQPQTVDLGKLFKIIVFSTQFDQTENCDYVAKIINYLNSSPVFSLENFKSVLDGIMTDVQPVRQPAVQVPIQQPSAQPPAQQPAAQKPILEPPAQQPLVQEPAAQTSIPQPKVTSSAAQIPVPQAEAFRQTIPQQTQAAKPGANPQEKKISMMTLLTHYSKENKELYKKQKNERKNSGKTGKKSEKKQINAGFAIPGQEMPDGKAAIPQPEKAQTTQPSVPLGTAQIPVQLPQTPPAAAKPVYAVQQPSANFGETTVLNASNGIGETTVLSAVNSQIETRPFLLRSKDQSKVIIDKPVFRIGKERSYVDYFIGDNSAISRSHANIIIRGEEYYVVDTNSTNHTYVNGMMIQSNVETKLSHGTKIQFANEEFEFRLY